jgi:hypothetical protein
MNEEASNVQNEKATKPKHHKHETENKKHREAFFLVSDCASERERSTGFIREAIHEIRCSGVKERANECFRSVVGQKKGAPMAGAPSLLRLVWI